jgi:hypothetical protein
MTGQERSGSQDSCLHPAEDIMEVHMTKGSTTRWGTSGRRPVQLAMAALAVLGLAWGWWPGASPLADGTPKLTLDRTVIDLGYLSFGTLARAAFTISNAGDGLLTLKAGRVRVVKGC